MKRLTVDELTRLAFIHAESDRQDFANCNPEGSVEREEALKFVKQAHAYRMKRWGKTKLEAALENATSVPVFPWKKGESI